MTPPAPMRMDTSNNKSNWHVLNAEIWAVMGKIEKYSLYRRYIQVHTAMPASLRCTYNISCMVSILA